MIFRRYIPLLSLAALSLQAQPPIRITTGPNLPEANICLSQLHVGSIYVRSEDTANGPIGVFRCTQTAGQSASSPGFAWLPIDHFVGATLPTSCATGDLAFRTGVTAGLNIYGCVSGSWIAQAGGAGGTPLFDSIISGTNTTAVMIVGSGAQLKPTDATHGVVSANQINLTSLAALATGLLKNTTGTGVPSIALANTDYLPVASPAFSGTMTGPTLSLSGHLTVEGATTSGATGTGGALVFAGSPALTTPTIASFVNATHNHTSAATGGTLDLTGSAFPNQGTTTTVLHGNAAGNPAFGKVSLSADVSGNLSVNSLNNGSSASASTFWRGDGIWASPAGAGTVIVVGAGSLTNTAIVTGGGAQSVQTPFATATLDTTGKGTFPGGLASGDGTTSGVWSFRGKTSGDAGWAAADIAGTSILYMMPTTNGAALNVLTDTGTATCGTFDAGFSSNCHQTAWVASSGTGSVARVTSPAFVTPTLGVATATSLTTSGGGVAGAVDFGQGTSPATGTNAVTLYGAAAITQYKMRLPAAAATGFILGTNTAGDVVQTFVASNGAGNVLLSAGTAAIASGKTLTVGNSYTTTATDGSTVAFSGGGTVSYTVASGASALGTSAIASGACATVVTTAATGTATTDTIEAVFNADPTGVTGYVPSSNGMLSIISYPTANNVNFKTCNNTSSSVTPGAITLNWRVVR